MSYTALYRKWRPVSFEDVKGQDPIVQTLKNQITSERVGHAYLFCGTRGTGKTSIAKIFARAVNCQNPINGSPCNECPSCKAILSGSSMNVVEIDAASNNGVENIRDIREQVQYPPTDGRYRVYIIDEVHMLSIGAFNALLKTLEEPPSYVATTEVHKIPITILSRCQRYDFKRISLETIADRLRELTRAEQIQVEDKALLYVAKAADGSLRDALSLLDQCVAFHFGTLLTYDNVLVWKALRALSSLYPETYGDLAGEAEELRRSILEHCVVQGPNGPYYAWSTDLEGHTDVYDEPPGSLLLLPYLGFCAPDDPAYQNTVRQIRAPEYPYSFAGCAFAEIGCAHAPHPWMLSVANSLLSGEAERSLDLLRRAVMDNGIVCESIDEHTGRSATGAAFATCAGFVCHALRYALGGVSYEN